MPSERAVTEDEWKEWLQHPCTKRLRTWAELQRQELMEQWATGTFTAAFDVEMAVKNAGATGACSIYNEIRELDFNQIGEHDEGKRIGPDSPGVSSVG